MAVDTLLSSANPIPVTSATSEDSDANIEKLVDNVLEEFRTNGVSLKESSDRDAIMNEVKKRLSCVIGQSTEEARRIVRQVIGCRLARR